MSNGDLKGVVILMVGPQGSGKTTVAQSLGGFRISQDEMGRQGHKDEFKKALERGEECIIIDRINHTKEQRSRYISEAKKFSYEILIVEISLDYDTCMKRIMARENHPTVEANNEAVARKCLDMYFSQYEEPSDEECDELYRRED